MLARDGYVPTPAASAEEALRLVEAGEQDVVVTDVNMPGGDGFSLLDAIHATPFDPPVILVSGYPCDDNIVRSVEKMSFAYITKPIDRDYFLLLVRQAVEQVERRAANVAAG
jgi:two-component system C4-dicarboxylate transport response regulator DctD